MSIVTRLRMVKTYFPTPSLSAQGPLNLGHIIEDLECSNSPLNERSHVSVSHYLKTYRKTGVRTHNQVLSEQPGVFAKLLSSSSNGGSPTSTSSNDVSSIESVKTIEFTPDDEYIGLAMSSSEVYAYMKACNYTDPVFMVTGLKVASGPSPDGAADPILAVRLKKMLYKVGNMVNGEHHTGATLMDDVTGEWYTIELEDTGDDAELRDVPGGRGMELVEGSGGHDDEYWYMALPKGF